MTIENWLLVIGYWLLVICYRYFFMGAGQNSKNWQFKGISIARSPSILPDRQCLFAKKTAAIPSFPGWQTALID
ncbi:hypothetical protein QT972_30695 [Microcoleus sp. herbarium7]